MFDESKQSETVNFIAFAFDSSSLISIAFDNFSFIIRSRSAFSLFALSSASA